MVRLLRDNIGRRDARIPGIFLLIAKIQTYHIASNSHRTVILKPSVTGNHSAEKQIECFRVGDTKKFLHTPINVFLNFNNLIFKITKLEPYEVEQ